MENSSLIFCILKSREPTNDSRDAVELQCPLFAAMSFLPQIFLWLCLPYKLYFSFKLSNNDIGWTRLFISKSLLTVITTLLVLVSFITDFSERSFSSKTSSVLLVITLALTFVYLCLDKRKGITSSGILFCFWLLLLICHCLQLYVNKFTSRIFKQINTYPVYIISNIVFGILVLIQVMLSALIDGKKTYPKSRSKKGFHLEKQTRFISEITFWPFTRLAMYGWKHYLDIDQLWPLSPQYSCQKNVEVFEKCWKEEINESSSIQQQHHQSVPGLVSKLNQNKEPWLFIAILKSLPGVFVTVLLLKVIVVCLSFLNPQILRLWLHNIQSAGDEDAGFLLAGLLLFIEIIKVILSQQILFQGHRAAIRIRSALIAVLFKKTINLSLSSMKICSTGKVINLVAVDTQNVSELLIHFITVLVFPLEICLAIYFLWHTLGSSIVAGIISIFALMVANVILLSRSKMWQELMMQHKDCRLRKISELVNGIKIVKLHAWEASFEKEILSVRNNEMLMLKKVAFVHALTSSSWVYATFVISLATFITFSLLSQDNILIPEKAFVALYLFRILQLPVFLLPRAILCIVHARVSSKRIVKFLLLDETVTPSCQAEQLKDCSLLIKDGAFSWTLTGSIILNNINAKLSCGKLYAIIGSVGSGKSSFVSACLSQMELRQGSLAIQGSVAFVSQEPWVLNTSFRENILFFKSWNQEKYLKILDACALSFDLTSYAARDLIEIGEKGVNLSGGQKQRLCLARAAYQDADIYFLDDPLSALDSGVSNEIFEKVISHKGLLSKKTRILVTNNISILPEVDEIFVFKKGCIISRGSYEDLMTKNVKFYKLIKQFVVLKENDINSSLSQENRWQRNNTNERKMSEVTLERSRNIQDGLISSMDHSKIGKVSWLVYCFYLKLSSPVILFMIFMLLVLTTACSVSSNFWLKNWSQENAVENSTEELTYRSMRIGIYSTFILCQAFLTTIWWLMAAETSKVAATKLHQQLIHSVFHSSLAFFNSTSFGNLMNRFSKDMTIADSIVPRKLEYWLARAFDLLGTILILIISMPILSVLIFILIFPYIIILHLYITTSRQLKRLESSSRSPIYSHFQESYQGAAIIKIHNKQMQFIEKLIQLVDQHHTVAFANILANRWLCLWLEMASIIVVFAAALYVLLNKHTVDSSTAALTVSFALSLSQVLQWFVYASCEVETSMVAVERIQDYCRNDPEVSQMKARLDWPSAGRIDFLHYSSKYRENSNLVLRDITFSVEPGQKIGIIGRTGAGKSSLVLALLRIIEPYTGNISIDDIDISGVSLQDLRSKITIIPQENVLFSGTIRFNLDPFEQWSDEELLLCVEHAHLKEFIESLPGGLLFEVTETNISIGQRQLICLARALLKKSKILILDEATASVDVETEKMIQKTIQREFCGCTMLIVTHRFNTVMNCDRILVLNQGMLEEFDSPENLLQKTSGLFFQMAVDAGIVRKANSTFKETPV